MNDKRKSDAAINRDLLVIRTLRVAPWLAFLLIALPFPIYFLIRFFTATGDAPVYMLLALVSLAAGSFLGLLVVALALLYRRLRERQLRERLASDGITADELSWFWPELKRAERRALRRLEKQDLLLADAYRETLAVRLTASRVISHAKQELALVERRLRRASNLTGANKARLKEELRRDCERLRKIKHEATDRRAEAEARLLMIEAMASRGASAAETEMALRRLEAARDHLPLGLEAARIERQAREEVEEELRKKQ
jgi:hypothetical protein